MGFLIILIVSLINNAVNQEKCIFDDFLISNLGDIYDPKSEEIVGIKQTILDVLRSYAYTDQLLLLPEEFKDQQTDIIKDIEDVKPENFNNYYDYNRALSKAINKVRDSHFKYIPPCFFNFAFFFPFSLKLKTDIEGNAILTVWENVYQKLNITSLWLTKSSKNIDIRGKTITKMILPDLDTVDNEAAAITFSRWSQKYSPLRTPFGRQTMAICESFSIRTFHNFDPPNKPVILTYLDDDNNEQTVEVPFLGFTNNKNATANSICPFETSAKTFASSFTPFNHSNVKINNNKIEDYNKLVNNIKEDNINNMVNDPLIQMRKEEIRESYKRLEREGKLDEFKDNNGTKPHHIKKDLYPDMYKKMRNVLFQYKASNNKRENGMRKIEEDNDDSNKDTFFYLGNLEGVSYIVHPYLKVLMFTIPTWSLKDEDAFLNIIKQGLILSKKYDCDKLIINKIGNTGGDASMSDFLVSVLFPRQHTSQNIGSFPVSDTNLLCESCGMESNQIASYPENKRMKKAEDYQPYRKETVIGEIDGEKRERTREWVRKYYSMNGAYLEAKFILNDKELAKIVKEKKFKPENTIILLDGVCISACATFVKYLSQKRLATTVNYGNVLYNPDNKKSDIADADSEEVVTLDNIYERQAYMKTSYVLPSRFKRTGGEIRFPVGAAYSINEGEENIMMEYKLIEADHELNDFIDYQNLRDPNYLVNFVELATLNSLECPTWLVQSNTSCEGPSEGNKIDHAIYGNPCNTETSSFDTSKCAFARCENGYYLNGGKCEKLPKLEYDKVKSGADDYKISKYLIKTTWVLVSLFIGITGLL